MQAAAVEYLRNRIDMEQAMSRINEIEMPIFVVGRDRDHNQATFRLAYDLMSEAGKTTQWKSYDHNHHGFIFVQRDSEGVYEPDAIQQLVLSDTISFFDGYMKN